MRIIFSSALTLLAATTVADAAGLVTLNLNSPQNGQTVAPGQRIDWHIDVEVSTGANEGLALLLVDLVQGIFNPALVDLPSATPGSAVSAQFEAPAGFSNVPSGFGGTPDGDPGARNLRQIGGAQNTFGVPGQIMGQVTTVTAGVGQSGPVVFAEGSFDAPSAAGMYAFQIEFPTAITLDAINAPPAFSPVSQAAAVVSNPIITFEVDPSVVVLGDLNCDGAVDQQDVGPFVLAVIDPDAYAAGFPSCDASRANVNGDGASDGLDIAQFVTCLLLGGCP